MEGPSTSASTSSSGSSRRSEKENSDDGTKPWGWTENKVFELALAFLAEGDEYRGAKIAAHLPGRSPEEVDEHYRKLLIDLIYIRTGLTELPDYPGDFVRTRRDPRLSRFRAGNTVDQTTRQSQEMQQDGTSNAIVQTTTHQSQEMQQEGTSNAEETDEELTE